MKTTLRILTMCIIIILNYTSTTIAQWTIQPALFNNFGQTDPANLIESVGIGDFQGFSNIPLSALHVNTNYLQGLPNGISYTNFGEVFRTGAPDRNDFGDIYSFWRMFSGGQNQEVEHLAIFNSDSWNILPSPYNDINFRASSGNMFFWTQGPSDDVPFLKRIMINNDVPANLTINGVNNGNAVDANWNTNGYVGIGFNTANQWDPQLGGVGPRSLLHLEGPNNTPWIGLGWRSWMRTGTFIKENSDNLYLGLKNEFESNGANRSDAVLSWGDDQYCDDCPITDSFRMIFTGVSASGNGNGGTNPLDASTYNGRELMRMTPRGRMGLGSRFTTNQGPDARLEILDEQNFGTGNSFSLPQLRLTHTQATPGLPYTTGITVDFQATSAGDLFINPRNATTNRRVGINLNNPGNTVEINSNGTFSSATIGTSGLRFSDMRSGSLTESANGKVLTVNANGDVILVDDIGGGGGSGTVTDCGSTSTASIGFVTRWSNLTGPIREICASQIFDDLTTVGVGVGSSVDNAFRFQISGDVLIQPNTASNTGDIYMRTVGSTIGTNERIIAMYGQNSISSLAIGPRSGGTGTGDINGVYIGLNAGAVTSNEEGNTFIGANSGLVYNGGAGDGFNTHIGSNSGRTITTGANNVMIGYESGDIVTTGDRNTFIGSLSANGGATNSDENVVIGYDANINGVALTTGTRNILLGTSAHTFSNNATITNAVSIGFNNRVVCDDCVSIAGPPLNTTYNEQQVGIGYSNPAALTVPPVGIGPGGIAKLYVSGWDNSPDPDISAFFNGDVYTPATYTPSDSSLKDNIQPYTNPFDILNQIEPKSYTFKHQTFPTLNLPHGNQIGLMANEVYDVAPHLIQGFSNPAVYDSNGNILYNQVDFVGVNYTGLVPVLIAAVKEQQSVLDSLITLVSNCCSQVQPTPLTSNNGSIRNSLNLSNNEIIILNQNSPNPFKDKTEITYILPESVKDAVILFYDHSGKVLQKFDISHRGAGSLTVYGEDLTSGVYTYSLIIDGENHQTKRMVKQ